MMQQLSTCLWFDNQAEEAAELYVSLFPGSQINEVGRYGEAGPGEPGSVMVVTFELAGQRFMALNGGPEFKINPSVSLFVNCDTEEEIDGLHGKLVAGGQTLMPLGAYPFAEKYAWISDRFGVSWQLIMTSNGEDAQKIIPALMFTQAVTGRAEKAMELYTSLFPDSGIDAVMHYEEGQGGPVGHVAHARFHLNGQPFIAMDGGADHDFTFNNCVSLVANCDTQAEIDHLWDALLADGGAPEQCGWLRDKFGVSWQIVPADIGALMGGSDSERARRVTEAVFRMVKIDLDELRRAYEGVTL
jgi:predicted 3-demethylubiquinone-9 3-methyltransferase (glyoxalase superfamily)